MDLGAWGRALFSDDVACDIRDATRAPEIIDAGLTLTCTKTDP
jgi:hypothetical protein